MPTFSLDTIGQQFYAASLTYSTAIQPYALKLFFSLFLLDLLITFIQYTADSAMDPVSYLGRFVRQILGAGFVLAMIDYGFVWMSNVIRSFGQLGSIITGLPPESPQTVAVTGINLALTILNSPVGGGLISSFTLAIVEALVAAVILGAFLWVAGELLLTLVRGYFTIGVGVIVLAFGGNRYTAKGAEGYFTNVAQTGVKILFIYATLAVGMGMVTSLEHALMAACAPTTTTVPWMTSYFTPPTAMTITTCTGTIALGDMFNYLVMALFFALLCAGIPRMAASLIGGPLGHALEDLASVIYMSRIFTSPIGSAAQAAGGAAAGAARDFVNGVGRNGGVSESSMQNFAADMAAQARVRGTTQSTQPLNPFNGQSPGYNMRPPSAPRPPAGPGLPPGSSSGSGGAALEYYPGRPGAKTKAEAVDITTLQNP
jgi:type IV secretion system protein TrbL